MKFKELSIQAKFRVDGHTYTKVSGTTAREESAGGRREFDPDTEVFFVRTLPDVRLNRLPVWARDHIEQQQRRIDSLEAELAKTWTTTRPAGPCLVKFDLAQDGHREIYYPAPPGTRYMVGQLAASELLAFNRKPTGKLEVRVESAGTLAVHPSCANVVHVAEVE